MPCFLFFKDDLSRGDGIADQAGKFHAQEGGVGGAGSEGLFYCPYGTGVKQDKVGRRTLADAAGIEMIEIRRIAGEAGEELPHGQISGLHKVFQAQGESRLQADHSAGSLGEILRLFEIRVGRGMGAITAVVALAPMLGLLGTVWGVLDAFADMGEVGSATIATMAPAISSALVTTVVGLLVAIPGVLINTHLNAKVRALTSDMEGFTEDLLGRIALEFKGRRD